MIEVSLWFFILLVLSYVIFSSGLAIVTLDALQTTWRNLKAYGKRSEVIYHRFLLSILFIASIVPPLWFIISFLALFIRFIIKKIKKS